MTGLFNAKEVSAEVTPLKAVVFGDEFSALTHDDWKRQRAFSDLSLAETAKQVHLWFGTPTWFDSSKPVQNSADTFVGPNQIAPVAVANAI